MKWEEWEIDKEMDERGILNPLDLTEFDSWVNKATRRDINKIIEKHKAFGLKVWEYEIIPPEKLKNAPTFSVDLIFLEKDREKVLELIQKHKNHEIDDYDFVKKLFEIAFYSCTWV